MRQGCVEVHAHLPGRLGLGAGLSSFLGNAHNVSESFSFKGASWIDIPYQTLNCKIREAQSAARTLATNQASRTFGHSSL